MFKVVTWRIAFLCLCGFQIYSSTEAFNIREAMMKQIQERVSTFAPAVECTESQKCVPKDLCPIKGESCADGGEFVCCPLESLESLQPEKIEAGKQKAYNKTVDSQVFLTEESADSILNKANDQEDNSSEEIQSRSVDPYGSQDLSGRSTRNSGSTRINGDSSSNSNLQISDKSNFNKGFNFYIPNSNYGIQEFGYPPYHQGPYGYQRSYDYYQEPYGYYQRPFGYHHGPHGYRPQNFYGHSRNFYSYQPYVNYGYSPYNYNHYNRYGRPYSSFGSNYGGDRYYGHSYKRHAIRY